MYYTYVLRSVKDTDLYTGFTKNLKLRFEQHQKGLVEATQYRLPLKLIYYEACLNQKDALNREKYLKSYHGKMYLNTPSLRRGMRGSVNLSGSSTKPSETEKTLERFRLSCFHALSLLAFWPSGFSALTLDL